MICNAPKRMECYFVRSRVKIRPIKCCCTVRNEQCLKYCMRISEFDNLKGFKIFECLKWPYLLKPLSPWARNLLYKVYYLLLDNDCTKSKMFCEMFFLFQYRILIYASKQQQVTTGKIHGNFSFTVIVIDINVNSD